MNKYWSDNLDTLTPYEAGEQPQDRSYIKLNTNENPYPPSDTVITAIKDAANSRLRLYPDPEANQLKNTIAEYYSIDSNNIFVGNGSDEVLGFSFQAFFRKSGVVQFPEITYSFYPTYCGLFGINFGVFPLTDTFEIDVELIPDKNAGIVIANPNAPTGIYLEPAKIEIILKNHSNSVVLIDEAYIDFGGESCIPLIKKYPNLLVVQTLSKSRSLAGLRVGIAVASRDLITGLERVKNSFNAYPLDALAIAGGSAAYKDKDSFEKKTQLIIETREWSVKALESLSFYVIPSKANFLMVQHKNTPANILYLRLKEEGILVRHFELPRINNFLRITIGTAEEMKTLINTLSRILES